MWILSRRVCAVKQPADVPGVSLHPGYPPDSQQVCHVCERELQYSEGERERHEAWRHHETSGETIRSKESNQFLITLSDKESIFCLIAVDFYFFLIM